MKLKKLIDHIQANGPVELSAALKALDLRENVTRTHEQLMRHMQEFGTIRFDTGKKAWGPSLCERVAARTPHEWKPLQINLYAHAALREGAMDYRRIPSVMG